MTPSGQHLICCLVNLLCRMVDTVDRIELDIPDVQLTVPIPVPQHPGDLHGSLIALSEWAVGDAVSITEAETAPDLVISLGGGDEAYGEAEHIYAVSDGWYAWVGTKGNYPGAFALSVDRNPLGAFLAASLVAGEVFKRSRGLIRGKWITDLGYCLWENKPLPYSARLQGPTLDNASLPPFYIIGAGAVGQGLHYLLGAALIRDSYVVTIDDDRHDETNLNRCFLAGRSDIDHPKVEAITRFRKAYDLDGLEFDGSLADYITSNIPDLRSDLKRLEADDRMDYVVSCVDKGTSRQDVQGLWPRLIFGGSTLGLTAMASIYDLGEGTPCLGCHNPPEKDGDTLRKVEQLVRAMQPDELRRYLAHSKDATEIENYILAGEKCGSLGAAQFRAFATEVSKEFSVSFVSMAAAVLLASRLLSRLIDRSQESLPLPPMTSVAFLNGTLENQKLSIDPQCSKCHGDPISAFRKNVAALRDVVESTAPNNLR